MKKILEFADKYMATLNWQDLSMIKFCLIALGILIGIVVPSKMKVAVGIVAVIIFVCTYIPMMVKFFKAWNKAHK